MRKSCYNKNRRKNNNNTLIQIQQPKIDNVNNKNTIVSTYENHTNVVIRPKNVGKIFYILKVLGKIGNKRPIRIITRSPSHYPNYKTSNEVKPTNKYKGSVVNFDDMLGAQNCSEIDEFLMRGRHEGLDVYCI